MTSRVAAGRPFRIALIAACVLATSPGTGLAQTASDFFRSDVLQDVRITISQRDWQTLKARYDLDTYYAADLRWNGVTLRNVGIRSRGNVTRNGNKPGLRIDINRYRSAQRFLGLTSFVLDNAYSDSTLMRERLAMLMFRRLGIAAPRETHTRLYINGDFAGVYLIVEAVDRAFLQDRFGAEEADVERGGYLFEYRWVRPYGFEDLGRNLAAYAELFTPQTRQTDSMAGLFGPIDELVRAVNESTDGQFPAAVEAYLELTQLVRYLAVENFLAELDGLVGMWGLHNFYLYRHHQDGRSILIPWDKDTGFAAVDHPVDFHVRDDVLVRRTLERPEFWQQYVGTLLECVAVAQQRDSESADPRGWLEREIDRITEQIREPLTEDPVYPASMDDFNRDVEWLRQFARQRPLAVACLLDSLVNADTGRRICAGSASSGR